MASNNPSGKKAHPTNVPRSRTDDDVWLIGPASSIITGRRLPTNQQVLSVYLHWHTVENKRTHESLKLAVNAAMAFWHMARIPLMDQHNCINKLNTLVDKYKKVKKGRHQQRNAKKEEELREMMCQLYDIAHHDAMSIITIEEDRLFLSDQRGERVAYMSSVDQRLANEEARAGERLHAVMKRKASEDKCQQELRADSEKTAVAAVSENSSNESDDASDLFIAKPSTSLNPSKKQKSHAIQIINSDLAATLNRTKTSDHSAMYTIAATSQALGQDVDALGQDVDALALSRSTISRNRMAHRTVTAHRVHTFFRPDCPVVVHWDGKLLSDLTGDAVVDRLPIVVSVVKTEQLLGVPQLVAGTGILMAETIYRVINECGITHKVFGMCFDTTALNTGKHAGACVMIDNC